MTEVVIEIDRMILDVLVGNSTQWPTKNVHPDYGSKVIDRVFYHGVAGLLNKSAMATANWPSSVIAAVYGEAIAQGMWELRHKAVVCNLLKAFHEQAIRPVILKGTAIAYDLYTQPSGRQRGDSDILIARHDLAKARSILSGLGFELGYALDEDADPISLQECWVFDAGHGSHHTIDLHWSVMNSLLLSNLFTYDEAIQNARHLPRLSEYACSFNLVYSLLFSCVHRAKHTSIVYYTGEAANTGGERLIWAFDIDLYAKALQPDEWNTVCVLAHEKGIARVCLEGLQYAARCLGTQIPDAVIKSLMAETETKILRYINEPSNLKRTFMDLQAVSGIQNKLRVIFKTVFPPSAFMRLKYSRLNHHSLLTLYCIRFYEFIFPKK